MMFQNLAELEETIKSFVKQIHEIAQVLQALAKLTFAIGFGELMKKAEREINQVGNAVVAATNAINNACKDVVNQLVEKFASEGAKSNYTSPPFADIHLKINPADRAAIYPPAMRALIEDMVINKVPHMKGVFNDIEYLYKHTEKFWVGTAADKTRHSFESRIVPQFDEVIHVVLQIIEHAYKWIVEAINYEASLGVQ